MLLVMYICFGHASLVLQESTSFECSNVLVLQDIWVITMPAISVSQFRSVAQRFKCNTFEKTYWEGNCPSQQDIWSLMRSDAPRTFPIATVLRPSVVTKCM